MSHPADTAPIDGDSIAPSAVVGERVSFGVGVRIGPGAVVAGAVQLGDRCIVGASAVIDAGDGELILEADAVVGPGATVAGALTIAQGAQIEAGTVVRRAIPPHAIVDGNPAEIVGYTLAHDEAAPSQPVGEEQHAPGVTKSRVRGVTLHRLPRVLDLRGNLTVGEFGRSVPFEAKRYFMVFDVPNAEIRGEHAHRTCQQFLICARGRCSVVADDGETREEFLLDDPAVGLYLPALTWGVQYKYSPDAVLLVFASEFYDSEEYIRQYSEFQSLVASR